MRSVPLFHSFFYKFHHASLGFPPSISIFQDFFIIISDSYSPSSSSITTHHSPPSSGLDSLFGFRVPVFPLSSPPFLLNIYTSYPTLPLSQHDERSAAPLPLHHHSIRSGEVWATLSSIYIFFSHFLSSTINNKHTSSTSASISGLVSLIGFRVPDSM